MVCRSTVRLAAWVMKIAARPHDGYETKLVIELLNLNDIEETS